jgi:hypothetical protein
LPVYTIIYTPSEGLGQEKSVWRSLFIGSFTELRLCGFKALVPAQLGTRDSVMVAVQAGDAAGVEVETGFLATGHLTASFLLAAAGVSPALLLRGVGLVWVSPFLRRDSLAFWQARFSWHHTGNHGQPRRLYCLLA